MSDLDTGESAAHEPQSQTGRRAHASRRNFMRKVFFASGATAVATMGGAGAWAALDYVTNGTS
ncbi:Tat pathway signal protein, partial [Streptomyces sp. NPDC006356]